MALTKADKDYVARNLDKNINELVKDLGLTKVSKELKTYIETLKKVTPTAKTKKGTIVKHGAFSLLPNSKTEDDDFHKVLPPPNDSIIPHEVKWPNR